MSNFSITEPSKRQKWIAGSLVVIYAVLTIVPLLWIIATGFKTPADSIAYPPKVVFQPTLEGYVNLFTTRTRATPEMPLEDIRARDHGNVPIRRSPSESGRSARAGTASPRGT